MSAGVYVTFDLAGHHLAVEVARVLQILGPVESTRVPRAREHVVGLINNQGRIVPILDLGGLLGFDLRPVPERHCNVIAEVPRPGGTIRIAFRVDDIHDVLEIDPARIESASGLGLTSRDACMVGMIALEDRMLLLIDLGQVLAPHIELAADLAAGDEP